MRDGCVDREDNVQEVQVLPKPAPVEVVSLREWLAGQGGRGRRYPFITSVVIHLAIVVL